MTPEDREHPEDDAPPIRPDGETVFSHDTRGWVAELQGACVLLAELPPPVADLLDEHMHEVHFAEGDYLIRQGDPGDSLLVIRSGLVQIGTTDEHGGRHAIARAGRGQILGEMALLTGEPRTADAIALKPVRAMVLPEEKFQELAKQHPDIGVVLTKIVARRLGASEHDVLAGKTLGGWLIHGRLGKGGMSVVYGAEDARGRRAALKMMSHRLVYDVEACRQFQREAEVIQSFDHPHIVRIYDRFAAFHTFFLALEFCTGQPLDEVLKARGAMPESEVRPIVGQIAAGLDCAHAAGIIHRDVKPANVMVTDDGTVKLMDFGLAQPVEELLGPNAAAIVGTPAYMAPEQLRGEPLTVAADLFALGAVIWEMLAGQRLIEKRQFTLLARQRTEWNPPDVRERFPELSDEMATIIATCLARSPEDRRVELSRLARWRLAAGR